MTIGNGQSGNRAAGWKRPAALLVGTLAVGVAGVVAVYRTIDNAIPRDVHTLCRQCGLDDAEIDGLIATMRAATEDRRTLLEVFKVTFEWQQDSELCMPCADAILDRAGK